MFDFLKRILNTGLSNPAEWFVNAITSVKSDSGIRVTGTNALSMPAVFYAVSKISGHVAQLPLCVHKRLGEGGIEKAISHPAYRLMKTRPNKYMTAAQFKETLMVHALIWGNAKAAIVRDKLGMPIELLIIDPTQSTTVYDEGRKIHTVNLNQHERLNNYSEGFAARTLIIEDDDVLHIPGLGASGVGGLQLFDLAKNSIGLGLAAEKASNKDFANGSRPGIMLEAPRSAFRDKKDADEFLSSFNTWHKGLDNVGRAGLIRENMKVHTLSHSEGASNWVAQRKFQRQEVALLFQLEAILGDDESVSYNSLEQKNLAYLSNCLMKWLIRIEQECDEKLLSGRQKRADSHYWKFNTAALLRADYKTTIEALGLAITHRILSPNEAREKLDLNPYDGGDVYENPAITPGQGDSEPEEPLDANSRAIVAHMEHRLKVEAGHVLRAAGNSGNYIGWLDKFYDKRWLNTMENACENLGGSREIGSHHCKQSKDELLEIAGSVTLDGLADAVAEAVESWPDKAEQLANEILTGDLIDV
tara:strand:+ start:431 stop:2023 length:1593 start_codon:yes stop_codon:yes gene_type:complete